jgi:hypothetical protein
MRFVRLTVGIILATCVSAAGIAYAGLSPEVKCQVDKAKIAQVYYKCLSDAAAKALKKRTTEDVAACDEKFAKRWQKATDKASNKGAACLDDAAAQGEVQAGVAGEEDTVSSLLSGCPGVPLLGTCWLLASAYDRVNNTPAQSCDDACAAVGMTYSSLTDTAISGAAHPLDVCFDLVSRLATWGSFDISVGSFGDDSTCSDLGCHILGGSSLAVRRCSGGPATSSAVSTDASRVCACE